MLEVIALGLIGALSSALAVAQAAFGWYPFPVWASSHQPGLFFNPVHAGQTLAILALVLFTQRLYWLLPGLLPGLWLAHSRGGWAALAFGLLATYFRHPLWLLVLILAGAVVVTLHPSSSDTQRLLIWQAAWTHLAFWGNGFGSFMNLFIGNPANGIIHPEYVHNDYLQTVFEFGVWSIIPFALIGWATSRITARDWPVLVAFLFMACFSMPLHMPIVAALGAIALITTLSGVTDA